MFDSISFFRIVKTGFVNFWRNLSLSAAATMVMSITLVIFAMLFLAFGITSQALKEIKNRIDISAYFIKGLGENQIQKIKDELLLDGRVAEVSYVSAEQALKEFREKNNDKPNILESLNELDENPLTAVLRIKGKTLDEYPAIAAMLKDENHKSFIENVSYADEKTKVTIDRLNNIMKFIVSIGVGVIVVFSLIAILVIFNTITLTIYNRKEEVEIMRLVGATNWYIRGPFLVESFLYGIFAAIITGALLSAVFSKFLPKIAFYVNPQISVFNQNIFNFWFLMLILLGLGLVLSVISTLLAIRRYLKI